MSLTKETLSPQLQAEVEEVCASLNAVAEDLSFPLNNLVLAEINGAMPYVRAGVVLAVAYSGQDNEQDNEQLRRQRICLASALEMLYVALNIHKLLLPSDREPNSSSPKSPISTPGSTPTSNSAPASNSTPASNPAPDPAPSAVHEADKVVMGGTILAGDYCFSRSAALATQTGHPDVVNIFAEALKSVSEAHLRGIFDELPPSNEEDKTLILAGVEAAVQLTDAATDEMNDHIHIATALINSRWSGNNQSALLLEELSPTVNNLTEKQLARWQEIIDWLTSH